MCPLDCLAFCHAARAVGSEIRHTFELLYLFVPLLASRVLLRFTSRLLRSDCMDFVSTVRACVRTFEWFEEE
jgi:hypothetical protein